MAETAAQRALTAATAALVVAVACLAMFLPPLLEQTLGSTLRIVVVALALAVALPLHWVFVAIAARRLGRSAVGWTALSALLFPVGSVAALMLLGWFHDEADAPGRGGVIARLAAAVALAALPLAVTAQPDAEALKRQVADTERAFARSMAERNHAAFTNLLSEQAVFWGGGQVQRGKAAVAAAWKGFFDGPKAPFSWEPDSVEVLADGTLAHSTGPVRDPDGKLVSRFNSVWRQEAPGVWRIVFDKGQPLTEADRKAADAKKP